MKKRILLLLIFISVLVPSVFIGHVFGTDKKQSRTIPCGNSGIIFSITTFDGKTETEPFIPCMGHTWVSVDNQSGHSVIEDYIDRNNRWNLFHNCSYWSIQLWNSLVDDAYQLKTPMFVYSPKSVQKSMHDFDGTAVDKDFSRAQGVFFYRDENRTELQLCQ